MTDHATTTAKEQGKPASGDSLHSALSLLVPGACALCAGSYFGDPLSVLLAVGLGSVGAGFIALALRRGEPVLSAAQIGLGVAVLSAAAAML